MIFTYCPKILFVSLYVQSLAAFYLIHFKKCRQSCLNNYANSYIQFTNALYECHLIDELSFLITTQNPVNRMHVVGGCTCMHIPVFNSSYIHQKNCMVSDPLSPSA